MPSSYTIELGPRFERDFKAAAKKFPELRVALLDVLTQFEADPFTGSDRIPGYPPEAPAFKRRIGTKTISAARGFRLIYFVCDDTVWVVRFYQKSEMVDILRDDALRLLRHAWSRSPGEE